MFNTFARAETSRRQRQTHHRGEVTDTNLEDALLTVTLETGEILENLEVITPLSGPGFRLQGLPEKGTDVVVWCPAGDLSEAIVLGARHDLGDDFVEETKLTGHDHAITFDKESLNLSSEETEIAVFPKSIELDANQTTLKLTDKNIAINSDQIELKNENFTVNIAKNEVQISGGSAKLNLTNDGIELSVGPATIKLSSSGVKINGPRIDLN